MCSARKPNTWFDFLKPDIPAAPPSVVPPKPTIAAKPRSPTAPKSPESIGSDAPLGHASNRRVGAGGGLARRKRNPLQ